MIWTIGYQRLAPARLLELAQKLDAVVVDTRFVPKTRVKGYGTRQLEALLGHRYRWVGEALGGRGHVTVGGIRWLAECEMVYPNVILLCVCHAPGDCHRHNDICAKHFPYARHIVEDEIVTAAELERSIRQGTDYACEYVEDVIG